MFFVKINGSALLILCFKYKDISSVPNNNTIINFYQSVFKFAIQKPLKIEDTINKNIMRKLKEFIKIKAPFIS